MSMGLWVIWVNTVNHFDTYVFHQKFIANVPEVKIRAEDKTEHVMKLEDKDKVNNIKELQYANYSYH